jgi:hypothetical protein
MIIQGTTGERSKKKGIGGVSKDLAEKSGFPTLFIPEEKK